MSKLGSGQIGIRFAAPLRRMAVQRAAQVFENRDLLPDLARETRRQILYVSLILCPQLRKNRIAAPTNTSELILESIARNLLQLLHFR
jgi:hypothetical protein